MPVICYCANVSDEAIRRCVSELRAQTIMDLRRELGVAARCGRCKPVATALLAECRRQCGLECPRIGPARRSRRATAADSGPNHNPQTS